MLLEIAIGDAYGAGFEYVNPPIVRAHNDLSGYVQHPRHLKTRPGMYTDDTQMSLAIAELLVEGADWAPANIAEKFVAVFKRDRREGYAGRFFDFLCSVRDGREFLQRIKPYSDKSGAAMRATPLGLLPSVDDVLDKYTMQARLTHDTPDGIAAANAAALAAHYCAHELGPRTDVGSFLAAHVDGEWQAPWKGRVGPKGLDSVRAAITALSTHDRLSQMLRACVAITGDVDTVAAICMGAASVARDVDRDLPDALIARLENGRYGRDYLMDLDRRLMHVADRAGE